MQDNIISIVPNEQKELREKRKAALKKLPQFRGEVPSRTVLRGLKDLQIGQIFWIELDNAAFVVTEIGKEREVKFEKIDENATISTGMTIFEISKRAASLEPTLDLNNPEIFQKAVSQIQEVFDGAGDSYFALYGRNLHYLSLIHRIDRDNYNPAEIVKEIEQIGKIINIEVERYQDVTAAEIWVRTDKEKAELLVLFPYDNGLIRI